MEGRRAVSGVGAPSSNPRVGGRVHVSLLDSENGYGYRGTYLGAKKVLTVGGAYQFEPKVTYQDTEMRLGENDYQAFTVDGFFEYPIRDAGTVTLSAAWEKVDLGNAYLGSHPDPGAIDLNGEKNGWYAKGGYLLPRVPLQVFGRVEKWRFACLENVFDQVVDWYGVGANYYVWGQNFELSVEFSKIDFATEGTFDNLQGASRTSTDYNSFVAQMQFIF